MPLTEKGTKVLAAMRAEYGRKAGERVFYASKNAGKLTGVDAADLDTDEGRELQRLTSEWLGEEADEPEHAAMGPEEMGTFRRLFVKFLGQERREAAHDGAAKSEKSDVGYAPAGESMDRCETCQNFLASEQSCSKVAGTIEPTGWCVLYARGRQATDAAPKVAASVAFVSPAGNVLLLKRSPTDDYRAGEWGLPGGKADDGETDRAATAARETREETGRDVASDGLVEARRTTTEKGWDHTTYLCPVADEFDPTLSSEHTAHVWAPLRDLPLPVHPALADTFADVGKRANDDKAFAEALGTMGPAFLRLTANDDEDDGETEDAAPRTAWSKISDESFKKLDRSLAHRKGVRNPEALAAWIGRKNGKIPGKDARDRALAVDRLPLDLGAARDRLASDKTPRTYDADGRMHVDRVHISRANVCPYWGREIPDWEKLGLDPNKKYRLYRDPAELKKAAGTFNGLPVLFEHQPTSADDHPHELVVGSTGTDAEFKDGYLDNGLSIWPKYASEAVEGGKQRELSCGYAYDPDMTPGRTPDGEEYDGVMRNLVGNHVALVTEGRAGKDVAIDRALASRTSWKRIAV